MHNSNVYNVDAPIAGLVIGNWFYLLYQIFTISVSVIMSQLVNQYRSWWYF